MGCSSISFLLERGTTEGPILGINSALVESESYKAVCVLNVLGELEDGCDDLSFDLGGGGVSAFLCPKELKCALEDLIQVRSESSSVHRVLVT